MPDPHCFDGLCSSTFTMLFNVALFSSLLLVPAALAVPSALGASLARRREGRQSQLNSRLQQRNPAVSNTQYSTTLAGAVLAESDVRSTGYSATAIDLIRISFHITGNFQLGHGDVHRPQPIGFDRGFCRRLGWYRWCHFLSRWFSPGRCHFHRFFQWSRIQR
jgi:hypothetical protein